MNIQAYLNEKLSKILFITVKKEIIKNVFDVELNYDVDLPVQPTEIINKPEMLNENKGLSVTALIESMYYIIGVDENFINNKTYEAILQKSNNNLKFIKGKISELVKNNNLEYAFFLLKGLTQLNPETEYFEKLIPLSDELRKNNTVFLDLEKRIIESAKNISNFPLPYIYEAILLNEEEDYYGAIISMNNYKQNNGVESEEIMAFNNSLQYSYNYSKGVELMYDDPNTALKNLLPLLDEADNNSALLYNIAICYRILKNHEKAIYYLNDALNIDPDYIDVINELGINLASIGDYEAAIRYLRAAFEATKALEICTNLIMCYVNINDLKQAKLHLDIAQKIDPEDEIVQQLNVMLK